MFTVQIHRRQIYIFYSQFLRWPWKGKGNFCREIKSLCQQICHWQQKWLTCVNMHNRTIQCMQGNEPYLVGSWGRKKNACFSKHTVSSISDPFFILYVLLLNKTNYWMIDSVCYSSSVSSPKYSFINQLLNSATLKMTLREAQLRIQSGKCSN